MKHRRFVVAFVITLALLVVPDRTGLAVPTGTYVGGVITNDQTWTKEGSPYYLWEDDVVVASGATLTIESGVRVTQDDSIFGTVSGLIVYGRLTAQGTAVEPITFDRGVVSPGTNPYWAGITFEGQPNAPISGSILDHVIVEKGDSGGANLRLTYAEITVRHAQIKDAPWDGILGDNHVEGGMAHISDTTFTNNGGYAVNFENASVNPVLRNLTASGNGYNLDNEDGDVVALGDGPMTGHHIWEEMGLPYRLRHFDGCYNDEGVAPGATLTIEPGVIVQGGSALPVAGTLLAHGTAEQPIHFTRSPHETGPWSGLQICGVEGQRAYADLDYVVVSYGSTGWGNIGVEQGDLVLANSHITDSFEDGVVAGRNVQLTITNTTFVDNAGYAVVVDGDIWQDASRAPRFYQLSAQGNGHNGIGFDGGQMIGAHVWQDGGIPFILRNDLTVEGGASLQVTPGVEVRFEEGNGLQVNGTLQALGTASRPITFTAAADTPQPGSWAGIYFTGSEERPLTNSALEHVVIEYGGKDFANLTLFHTTLPIHHAIIRYSGKDGIGVDVGGDGSVVEQSQIVGNADFGIRNLTPAPGRSLLAAHNWWGSPSGPTSPSGCNPGGGGDKVSQGVAFRPFLTEPGQEVSPFAPTESPVLTLSPQRWFVPADGVSQGWVRIRVHDGSGRPLPGRKVGLSTNLGAVEDGGITNVNGETYAVITSNAVGEATLIAVLDSSSCEQARSAQTHITFTPPNPAVTLLPEAEAPYMDSNIEIEPEPVTQGVTTTLSVRLVNPTPYSITVTGGFGYAQAGIGLTFGPISAPQSLIIPAQGEATLQSRWTPPISGHFCIEFSYTWQPVGEVATTDRQSNTGRQARNLDSRPATHLRPSDKDIIAKANRSMSAIDDGMFVVNLLEDAKGTAAGFLAGALQSLMLGNLIDFSFDVGGGIRCAMEGGEACGGYRGPNFKVGVPLVGTIGNLVEDPPRQDYDILAVVEPIPFTPLQPDATLPSARADALNDLVEAVLDLHAKLFATVLSQDRYGGAVAAGDITWSSLQVNAYATYRNQSAQAMLDVAQRLDALIQQLEAEGIADVVVTADDYRAYQERLRTQSFSVQEREIASRLGLADEALERIRLRRLALDPDEMAGSQLAGWHTVAIAYRAAGEQLLGLRNFQMPGSRVARTERESLLARVYDTVFTVQVANPLPQTAEIDLRLRPIDLPPDWRASVTPMSVTLQSGEQITATIVMQPGTATAQGLQPRVAVEGYAGHQLLGGVVLRVMVPKPLNAEPPSQHQLFLPMTLRAQ